FFIGKNSRGNLQDIVVYQLEHETNVVMTVHAPRGKVEVDAPKKMINLYLYDAKSVRLSEGRAMPGAGDLMLPLDLNQKLKHDQRPDISDMTFSQLWDELHDLEKRVNLAAPVRNLSREQIQAR